MRKMLKDEDLDAVTGGASAQGCVKVRILDGLDVVFCLPPPPPPPPPPSH